jgi:hypothetical protein
VQRKRLPHPGAGTARLPQVSGRAYWYRVVRVTPSRSWDPEKVQKILFLCFPSVPPGKYPV